MKLQVFWVNPKKTCIDNRTRVLYCFIIRTRLHARFDVIAMARTIDEPIVMSTTTPNQPGQTFVWRDQEHEIQAISSRWSQRGCWWIGEGCQYHFHITTLSNLVMDLCFDSAAHSWTLAKIWD